MKYLKVYHTDFWISEYKLNKQQKNSGVEVFISNDIKGEDHFLAIDILTVNGLKDLISDKYFKQDYTIQEQELLHKYYEKLKMNEIYCFIENILFFDYNPDIDKCNTFNSLKNGILDIISPPQQPTHVTVYVSENKINTCKDLKNCLKKLFYLFDLEDTEFEFAYKLSKQEVLENANKDENGYYT